jgi:hypothetical protein
LGGFEALMTVICCFLTPFAHLSAFVMVLSFREEREQIKSLEPKMAASKCNIGTFKTVPELASKFTMNVMRNRSLRRVKQSLALFSE